MTKIEKQSRIVIEYRRTIISHGETQQFMELIDTFYEYNAYLHRKFLEDIKLPNMPEILKRGIDYILEKYNGRVPEEVFYPLIYHFSSLKSYAIHDGGGKVTVLLPSRGVKKGIEVVLHCEEPIEDNEKIDTVQIMVIKSEIVGVIHTIKYKTVNLISAEEEKEQIIKKGDDK